jgi:hypothetical protein
MNRQRQKLVLRRAGLVTAGALLAAAGVARADVAPPPSFLVDSLYLGWPVGPVVGLCLAAAATGGFFWLRRRGAPRWLAALLGVLGYMAVNFAIYVYALNAGAEARQRAWEEKRRGAAPDTGAAVREQAPAP